MSADHQYSSIIDCLLFQLQLGVPGCDVCSADVGHGVGVCSHECCAPRPRDRRVHVSSDASRQSQEKGEFLIKKRFFYLQTFKNVLHL